MDQISFDMVRSGDLSAVFHAETDTLASIRQAFNLTQEELADKTGLTRDSISSYECGKRMPGSHALLQLAESFGLPMETIYKIAKRGYENAASTRGGNHLAHYTGRNGKVQE